jgi:hypothetical protein
MTPTLFQKLLGASFYSLPPAVRALHGVRGRATYAGSATIERGRNPLARLCASIARLPRTQRDVATTVHFDSAPQRETWRRDFGGTPMQSRLQMRGTQLDERLGPIRFRFNLHAYDGAIHWNVASARLFGMLPLPAMWFHGVRCREAEQDGRYTFLVEAALPLIGRIIRYEGWLEPHADA